MSNRRGHLGFAASALLGGLAFFLASVSGEAAETFSLTNGSVVTGEVVGEANGIISINTQYGVINVPAADIVSRQPAGEGGGSDGGGGGAGGGAAVASDQPLRLQGSNTIGSRLIVDLLREYTIARGFSADFVEVQGETQEDKTFTAADATGKTFTIAVGSHGSGTAFKALAENKADIGMSSRRINDKEIKQLEDLGLGTLTSPGLEHVLALDGLAVIVHPDNPVNSLSLKQIADIFAGRIKDWSEIGPFPGAINVYRRDGKSGTYDTFKTLVMSGEDVIATAKEFESSPDLSASVSGDPLGIGFIGLAYVLSAKPLAISQSCGLTSLPSEYSVKTEEYPLSRRLFLYNPTQQRHPNASDFLTFALSNDAQSIVKDAGFIDLSPEASGDGYADEAIRRAVLLADIGETPLVELKRFADLIASQNGARLSITYRFESGSANLDNRALRDLDRLADYWKAEKEKRPDAKLVVLGFADSVGRWRVNKRLSEERAGAVAQGLAQRSITPDLVEGLGELAPVACDDTDAGKSKNRRVEIWVF